MFGQMAINGLYIGMTVLLVAIGFSLVTGVMRQLNFAHAEWYMLGAFLTWYGVTVMHIPYWLALVVAIAVLVALGILVERFLFRRLRGNLIGQLVLSIGLILIFDAGTLLTFGTETKSMGAVFPGILRFRSIYISTERTLFILISVFVFGVIFFCWRWARIGRAMRALCEDTDMASLLGVNPNQVSVLVWIVAAALAALAGGLLATAVVIEPSMGASMLLMGLIALILSGMGTVGGLIVGANIIGLIDSYATTLLGTEFASMVLFIVLMVFLILRPRGLWGQEFDI